MAEQQFAYGAQRSVVLQPHSERLEQNVTLVRGEFGEQSMVGLASFTITSGALTAAVDRMEPSNSVTRGPWSGRPRRVTRA